jgi:hypothetical protein
MRNLCRCMFLAGTISLFAAFVLFAQSNTGAIDFTVLVTPTGAHPEPIRQFTFYVLTKSYAEIMHEIDSQDVLPTKNEFLEKWPCTPQLKKWMKAHDTIDLTAPDLDRLVSPDDIMNIPEFFSAYERSNSGGVTKGLPQPKFTKDEEQTKPARYQKDKDEWLAATRKFIETNTYTIQGIELELTAVNPKPTWDKIHTDHRLKVAQLAPDTAQSKYLAAKADTDLEGRAVVNGLPAGTYWISSLSFDASSGDRRLIWDVPANVVAGKTTRLELNNLNGSAPKPATAP